jgi:hypothetical protein
MQPANGYAQINMALKSESIPPVMPEHEYPMGPFIELEAYS